MMIEKVVIFDWSGTLSPEAVRFAEDENLKRELERSGLASLGMATSETFWNEIVNPTWEEGSTIAAGTETAKSDIDLMVIGELSMENLLSLMRGPERILGRQINSSLYSAKEYGNRMKEKDPFVARVTAEPRIVLMGEEDELQRIGG